MNSEELEQSLRTEFESYLKTVLADIRQESTEFQRKIEADLDKQKVLFDEAFRAFSARFDSTLEFDEAFRGSVAEHLRLARDEGAKITANAIAEAEKLAPPPVPVANFQGIAEAVADIGSKDSQSSILKTLVQHAGEFAPRGAFFIIKNEHFVGWKVIGAESEGADEAIREIRFPMSADSIVGTAVRSLCAVESRAGEHADDFAFLEPLEFGLPDRMVAVPLMARGRGVAVLYADQGSEATGLNREALETLVRVAGLTVELHAASQPPKTGATSVAETNFEDVHGDFHAEMPPVPEHSFDDTFREMPIEPPMVEARSEPAEFSFVESDSHHESFSDERDFIPASDSAPFAEEPYSMDEAFPQTYQPAKVHEEEMPPPTFEEVEAPPAPMPEPAPGRNPFAFEADMPKEPVSLGGSPFDKAAEEYEPAGVIAGAGYNKGIEPVAEAPAFRPPSPRLSDRPVDLPIEVPEEERRIHNDARRFARLLVSEIKLYNEKKVIEGRQAQDLYDRLREAIDRSREMYDKRVQPPVAAKFDYFHYEIVNSLADGNVERLGSNYPGATI